MAYYLRLLTFFLAAAVLACGTGSEDSEHIPASKTVDVPPTIEIPIEDDEVAAPRQTGFSGVLPTGFPEDLPLFTPSSLIDFGNDDQGPWVDLLTDNPSAHVEALLVGQARSAGWSAQASADGNAIELQKEGVRVLLTFRDGKPGTIYRYVY